MFSRLFNVVHFLSVFILTLLAAVGVLYMMGVYDKPIHPTIIEIEEVEKEPEISFTKAHKDISEVIVNYTNLDEDTAIRYAKHISDASKTFGVNVGIITGMMIAESTGRWDASSGIADGLMQVRWDIHGPNIKKAFSKIKNKADFMKPRNNIHVGVWIFSYYLRSCNGDYKKALQKYSGGANSGYYERIFRISKQVSGGLEG